MEEKIATVTATRRKRVHIFVTHPFRGNFNDEYYLFDRDIPLAELKDKPLRWFDPYFGKSKVNDTEIAVSTASDTELVILERSKKTGVIKEQRTSYSALCVEDFDESRLLASHIELRS